MRKNRAAIALAVVSVAIVTLTGCASSLTISEAEATPGTIIETASGRLFEVPTFEYVAKDGWTIQLDDCARATIFDNPICKDGSGVYQFQYVMGKGGRIGSAALYIDGSKQEYDCAIDPNNVWDGMYICVPEAN